MTAELRIRHYRGRLCSGRGGVQTLARDSVFETAPDDDLIHRLTCTSARVSRCAFIGPLRACVVGADFVDCVFRDEMLVVAQSARFTRCHFRFSVMLQSRLGFGPISVTFVECIFEGAPIAVLEGGAAVEFARCAWGRAELPGPDDHVDIVVDKVRL
jgi:hypothetical protein